MMKRILLFRIHKYCTSGCSVLKSELAIRAAELPGAEINLSAVRGLGRTAASTDPASG